ncbi:MAG: hypothetical protein IJY33_06690 [Oscillospiraceae bacterium]|nr:hypothetical protein [Oscillospiraceae bacterium]MBQ8868913.1 hypothetical protein [Oscillospiraceae bacterium]
MNIIYFGYDLFAPCLKELASNPEINVLKVYSFEGDGYFDKNDEVKEICAVKNIPFTTEKITVDELKCEFEQNGCDLAFSAGYAYRIPCESVPVFRGVNIHPSLLPDGRGPWPFPHIILKGLKKSGVTAHKIAERFDEGEILLQAAFEVAENETYRSLEKKAQDAALDLTRKLISDLENYWKNAVPQAKGEYWKEPSDNERTIYLNTSPREKDKIIRAFIENFVIYSDKNKGE